MLRVTGPADGKKRPAAASASPVRSYSLSNATKHHIRKTISYMCERRVGRALGRGREYSRVAAVPPAQQLFASPGAMLRPRAHPCRRVQLCRAAFDSAETRGSAKAGRAHQRGYVRCCGSPRHRRPQQRWAPRRHGRARRLLAGSRRRCRSRRCSQAPRRAIISSILIYRAGNSSQREFLRGARDSLVPACLLSNNENNNSIDISKL